jgi:CDP-paratose 2-epimerase
MGGSRHSNCSMLEAIRMAEGLTGRELNYTLSDEARSGDHIWWISDVRRFRHDYPEWEYAYDMRRIMEEIVAATKERAHVSAG